MTSTDHSNHIDNYLNLADSNWFKLWVIVANDSKRKNDTINYLTSQGWVLVDVGKELSDLKLIDSDEIEDANYDIGLKIKDWFYTKPDKLILVNANILYHKVYSNISPIGAFKYNSRNKQCILLLEDVQIISNRVYYGKVGDSDYNDSEVDEILLTKVEDLEENYTPLNKDIPAKKEITKLLPDAIGNYFNYTPIKDVIDIDYDLRDQNSVKDLVSSYVISESLEKQLIDFFENARDPKHKAVKVVGNYGSGKSHLISLLISVLSNPDLIGLINNIKVRESANKVKRDFLPVNFELMPGDTDLSTWFYREIKKQLLVKYNINIPSFKKDEDINDKDNIKKIINEVKKYKSSACLLVVIDEVSDFLAQKETFQITRDFQFLRIVAQACQSDVDMLVVTSMQEDVYTSPKFKDIAGLEEKVSQRFLPIYIRRESINDVISKRIVPKTKEQVAELSGKLKPYSDKIEDFAVKLDQYIDLFPLTPTLLDFFQLLPYFEKRGVIQFAQRELKYILNEPFPFFLTFDRVFDLIELNPNNRYQEEVYPIIQAMDKVKQKINIEISDKNRNNTLRIVKALAVYSLWTQKQTDPSAQELVESLLIIPENRVLSANDYVIKLIQDIRNALDGFYIKVTEDKTSGRVSFRFDPQITEKLPDEIIDKEINTISVDVVEHELFSQIVSTLDLFPYNNLPDIFEDECIWQSVKSFRSGYVLFIKKGFVLPDLEKRDYAIAFISPFLKDFDIPEINPLLKIKINLNNNENLEHLKRLASIRQLISKNVSKSVMSVKLSESIEGTNKNGTNIPGIKSKITRWIYATSETDLNGNKLNISTTIGREPNNLFEIISELKKKVFDKPFTELFPEHPRYPSQLSSSNILSDLSNITEEFVDGDFTSLTLRTKEFLKSLNLINLSDESDFTNSKLAQQVYSIINQKGSTQVTDIKKELISIFIKTPYGVEPEIIYLILVYLTVLGKISLKAVGGDTIDISNINNKYKSLAQFDTIAYAIKKADLSYDFASRLLNSLGLNGAKILQDSTRDEIFKDYKVIVENVSKELKNNDLLLEKIKEKQSGYIDLISLQTEISKTKCIDWNTLNIANRSQFTTLENLSPKLSEIKIAFKLISAIHDALSKFLSAYLPEMDYLNTAVELTNKNQEHLTDKTILTRLEEYLKDSKLILSDIFKFLNKSERLPLEGKFQAFKKLYVNDFYYPLHENTIGKKIDWNILINVDQNELFLRIKQLTKINCINTAQLNTKINLWKQVLQLKCTILSLDNLEKIPYCIHCGFLKSNDKDYKIIKTEIKTTEKFIEELVDSYSKTIISEITSNQKNLEFVTITSKQKEIILNIIKSKSLPDLLDDTIISAINQLFRNFKVVELEKEKVLNDLFSKDKLMTVSDLRKNFFELEARIKQNGNEEEIRLKFD